MAAQESPCLGVCPSCGEEIHRRHILIRYETESGEEDARRPPSYDETVYL
jgi:anti-sigma factor ChrR (cupin superfamily)